MNKVKITKQKIVKLDFKNIFEIENNNEVNHKVVKLSSWTIDHISNNKFELIMSGTLKKELNLNIDENLQDEQNIITVVCMTRFNLDENNIEFNEDNEMKIDEHLIQHLINQTSLYISMIIRTVLGTMDCSLNMIK